MPKIVPYKKNGKTMYKFQVYTGINPSTGKESTTTRRGFKTKAEAKVALSRIMVEVAEGRFHKSNSEDIEYTFKEVFEMFWKGYQHTVRPSTLLKVDSIYRSQILPYFGSLKIDKVTTSIAQEIVNQWVKYESCSRYINYTSRVFNYALKIGMIDVNPMDAVIRPKKQKKKPVKDFWNKDELKHFLNGAKNYENKNAYPFFRLLAFTGIRKGEALALNWSDVDYENETLNIDKTIARKKSGIYIEETKNSSNRKVSIDRETLTALENIRNDNELVFSNLNGAFIAQSKPRIWLRAICKEIDLEPIKVHGLRHTHASLLFEAGANIKEVQQRLGHSDAQITMNIYTHITEQSRDDFAEKFSNFIDF